MAGPEIHRILPLTRSGAKRGPEMSEAWQEDVSYEPIPYPEAFDYTEAEMIARGVEQVDVAIVKPYAQDLRGLLEEAGFTERKAFLRSFIKRIEVNRKQVTVHYNLPIPQSMPSSEQVAVLPIDTLGGAEGIRTPDLLRARKALSQLSYSPKTK